MILQILVFLGVAASAVGQSQLPSRSHDISRMLVPQNERYQFIATAKGVDGMRVNPASVASSRGINFHYNTYIERGKFLEHDFFLQNFLFNVAYRRATAPTGYHLNHYGVTIGGGIPEITFGASFNWLRSNLPAGSNGNVIHVGLLLRPNDWLSIAAAKRNINQPVLGGIKLVGRNIVGAGVHLWQDRIILAAEATAPNGGRIEKDVTYRFGGNVLIVDGLRSYAVYENPAGVGPRNFFIGINLYIPNFDLSYDAHLDEDREYQSGVAGVTYSTERKRTIFNP